MKQFELCALGLQELDAKEQLETTGGEVFAFLAACTSCSYFSVALDMPFREALEILRMRQFR